jgi:hypothetical protein
MMKLDNSYRDTWVTRSKQLCGGIYADYLKSDEWLKIHTKAKNRDNYKKCYVCGISGKLDLHHMSYNTIGTTDLRNIRSVCREHHQAIHDYARENNISVRLASRRYRKHYKKVTSG